LRSATNEHAAATRPSHRDDSRKRTLAHAPADHPKVTFGKIGILLANLGTPDHYSYWPMRRYLNEFLSDKRVIDYSPWIWQPLLQLVILTKRPFSSGAAYKSIWNEEKNESPLMTITKDQTAKMKARLEEAYGDKVVVDFCMRYGNPSTKSKVDELVAQGCTKILFFPLYPQYAGATSATACDEFFRALQNIKWQPIARTVEPYYEHPLYIEALAQSSSAPMPGWKTARRPGGQLSRRAEALPDGGRPLSLPVPEDVTPA
jgi:ferrochelatase